MTKLFSRDSQHEFGRVLSTTTLMWFPFAVVFVYLPITIFYHNRIDFDYDAMVLAPFLLLGFLAFGIVFALSYFSTKWQQIATTPLFFIGVFLFLSDSLVPLQWGLMDGDEVLTESGRSIAVQLGLACAVIAAWWFLPKEPVQKFGVSLVALIVGWHLALLAHSTVASPSTATPAQGVLDRPTSHLPNIYHIVFDAYSALSFPASTESNKLAETLAGFTNFPNNLSNYVSTDASTPSFLTGKLFAGGSFKDFQNEARVGGLRQSLKEAGYRISVYAPNQSRFWAFENSDYVFTSQQINQEDGLLKLAQIVAVRAAPEALRDETLALFQSFLKDEYSFYKRLSVPLFEKLLQDERQRSKSSEYIYAHLILPHSPYVWDETCNMNASASNYDVQVLCATKLMKDLVQQLKNTDKYANSLIIFQSDHGFQGSANARSPLTPPPAY